MKIFILSLTFFLLTGCQAQTEKERMLETSHKIVETLRSGNEKDFVKFIGPELRVVGKDDEMIGFDFLKLKKYFKEYLDFAEPKYVFIDKPNSLGQKKIQVVFHQGIPKSTTDYDVRLDLEFGPPNFFPLSKISGYRIIDKLEALYPTPEDLK